MALSIDVSVGSRIGLDGHLLQVKALRHPNLIVLSVDKGKDVMISDRESTEILPTVFVFSGAAAHGEGNRLAFNAPKAIRISRIEHSPSLAQRSEPEAWKD